MEILRRFWRSMPSTTVGLTAIAILALGTASCRSPNEPAGTSQAQLDDGWPETNKPFQQVSYSEVRVAIPQVEDAEFIEDDEFCGVCHEGYAKAFGENVHRNNGCESCHGPASQHLETRGKEPGMIFSFKTNQPAVKSEMCLKCHEEDQCSPAAQFRTSKHTNCGVACTDCHTSHYNVPPGTPVTTDPGAAALDKAAQRIQLTSMQDKKELPSLRGTSNALHADGVSTCLKCHTDKIVYHEMAGPHQIHGPNGFECTTCHDPHGNLLEYSRKDLCLQCHKCDSPTMAWHSSIHSSQGVACTDCHNPHPNATVEKVVNISHTQVKHAERIPMAVDEPAACYKCHPEVFGKTRLPSHHPIREGRVTCSDCHDPHGQSEGNLKAETLNLLCYKCHAEKQGPFVYEHPPVTENCGYCHDPHGTIANNLLKQPTTFLCLRCHNGHQRQRSGHSGAGIDHVENQIGFYTDCARCHTQVHGSDVRSPVRSHDMMR